MASVHSAVIYYWSASAEPVYIRKMIARYETSPSAQNRLRSAVDLYRCATQAFSFPTKSYGLKDIAGHLGFTWHDASYDGLSAMMDYGKYLKSGSTKTTIRNKLLRYNGTIAGRSWPSKTGSSPIPFECVASSEHLPATRTSVASPCSRHTSAFGDPRPPPGGR